MPSRSWFGYNLPKIYFCPISIPNQVADVGQITNRYTMIVMYNVYSCIPNKLYNPVITWLGRSSSDLSSPLVRLLDDSKLSRQAIHVSHQVCLSRIIPITNSSIFALRCLYIICLFSEIKVIIILSIPRLATHNIVLVLLYL